MTAAILQSFLDQGVFAVIRCRAPLAELLEVGDALLATPLTVVAIAPGSREPWTAISELRSRFGRNMVVGVGPLSRPEAVTSALAAGAQFVLGAGYQVDARQRCAAADVLYIPAVATTTALRAACDRGERALLLFPAARSSYAALLTHPDATGITWLALGGVTPAAIPALAQCGVSAVGVRGVLPAGVRLDMASLIRRLRRVVQAWRQAEQVCGS